MSINPKKKTVIGIIAVAAAIIGAIAAVVTFLKRKSKALCGCSDLDGNVYDEDEDDYMEDYHYISENEEAPGAAETEETVSSEEPPEESADSDADWEKNSESEEE